MFKDETWLITGAAGALGSALATALAAGGAKTILLDRERRRLDLLADRIESAHGVAPFLMPMDLLGAKIEEYQILKDSIESNLSKLNGIIHCAATQRGLVPHEQISPAEWQAGWQLHLHAPYWLSRTLLPLLTGGWLVFPLESLATMAGAYRGVYGIGQWALHALVRQIAAEWRGHGVRVIGIETGPFYSPLYSAVRPADPPATLPAAAAVAGAVLGELGTPLDPATVIRTLPGVSGDAGEHNPR